MQKRRLDKSFEEVAESHGSDEEEDRDSDHGALPQIIPELPIIMPTEAVIRRPSAMKALQIELMVLQRELEEATCKVHLVDSDLFDWEVELTGPEESPYQGGIFRFLLKFPPDYPEHMPRIRCATPVFHCNIDRNGNVCLGTFDENGLSPAALVPRIDDGSIDQFLRTQLRIAVISARGLRNADFGGASDPYCTCQVPEKDWTRFQTAVIKDTMNPVWNEEHMINDYTTGDPLDFEIFDDDDGDDELLGRCTLNSEAFYPEGFDGEVALSDTGKTQTSKLRVKVSVVMPPRVQDRTTALDIVEALLSLLTLPILQHPLVPAAARLFIDDRQQYDRVARDWTLQYAL
jgi:ubiquitin-protein ligase